MSSTPPQIGPYRVRREIGRGGMGVVYLARDTRLDRDVAIKAVAPETAGDEQRLARFKREARLVAQLNHPRIAQVYHLLEHEDRTYLVLEYVPGRSLADVIDRDGPLPPETALGVCGQVARAVEAAHARGIVHRDLKPANVRITPDGTAKVLDFGLARARAATRRPPPARAMPPGEDAAIRPSTVVGTPGYMAPEQARGEPVDGRADVFSIGCILYECLTGRGVFTGDTPDEVIEATLTTDPDWSRLPGGLAPEAAALLRRCLARRPDERWPSAGELRAALDAAAGRTATPPPSPLPPDIPHSIPQVTTSFVGRADELRELSRLLGEARLLTLTGAGGCGKTRLALELARRGMTAFPDGVFVAELAATDNAELVAVTVAAALGVKDRPHLTATEAVAEHVAGRTLLLVLDNCEHVLEAAADVAEAMLAAAPGLRVVATSREPLRVPGEQLWRVAGLSLPRGNDPADVASAESVTLFMDRARALDRRLALDDANAADVARICRTLDGIPLAIELAAARAAALSPREIERRLDDRLRLLKTDARGVAERHRTLRAAVDWSYRTLSESEKRMLRWLSVFAGGWTLEAAAAVCGPAGCCEDGCDLDELAVLDLLTRLVNKSLVFATVEGGESRYRMLETVRQFAAEQLEETGESHAALGRHLDFFLALAREAEPHLAGAEQPSWLRRLEADHDNILAAIDRAGQAADGAARSLRLCRALMRFWLVHGHYRRGLETCTRALAPRDAQERTTERAAALYTAAVMAQALGDYERAMRMTSEAMGIQRELGDWPGVARSLNSLGNSAYFQGDLNRAQQLHAESLVLRRELDDRAGIAMSLNNLANVAHDRGRLDEAQRQYEEALAINRASGNPASVGINLFNLGIVAVRRGDLAGAERLQEESLRLRRDLADRHGIAESLCQLGRLARLGGDRARARRLDHESLEIRQDLGEKLGITDSLDECAQLAVAGGEHERAARLVGAVERLRREIGAPRPEPEQADLDAGLAPARAALGLAGFSDAVGAGRDLPFEDAVDETLRWLGGEAHQSEVPTRALSAPRQAAPE